MNIIIRSLERFHTYFNPLSRVHLEAIPILNIGGIHVTRVFSFGKSGSTSLRVSSIATSAGIILTGER